VIEAEDMQAGLEAYRIQAPDFVWLDLHIRSSTEFLECPSGDFASRMNRLARAAA